MDILLKLLSRVNIIKQGGTRLYIPKEISDKVGYVNGDQVTITLTNDNVLIVERMKKHESR